ncbi:MAG: DNA-binding protein, partial [Halothiobacillaceae bacterium]
MADREQWQWRKRKGRGGGREYHLTSLPAETRAALLARQSLPAESAPAAGTDLMTETSRVTDGQRRTAMARAGLCRAIDRM